jgi:hypothetical protein
MRVRTRARDEDDAPVAAAAARFGKLPKRDSRPAGTDSKNFSLLVDFATTVDRMGSSIVMVGSEESGHEQILRCLR